MVGFHIDFFIPSFAPPDKARVDFGIDGEPKVQNGWKVQWRNLSHPRVYDPRAREKAALRRALLKAISDVQAANAPPVFPATASLKVTVRYYLSGRHDKDLDNMTKFLSDAMEGAIFPDDKCIKEMHLFKEVSPSPRTIVTVELLYEGSALIEII